MFDSDVIKFLKRSNQLQPCAVRHTSTERGLNMRARGTRRYHGFKPFSRHVLFCIGTRRSRWACWVHFRVERSSAQQITTFRAFDYMVLGYE